MTVHLRLWISSELIIKKEPLQVFAWICTAFQNQKSRVLKGLLAACKAKDEDYRFRPAP